MSTLWRTVGSAAHRTIAASTLRLARAQALKRGPGQGPCRTARLRSRGLKIVEQGRPYLSRAPRGCRALCDAAAGARRVGSQTCARSLIDPTSTRCRISIAAPWRSRHSGERRKTRGPMEPQANLDLMDEPAFVAAVIPSPRPAPYFGEVDSGRVAREAIRVGQAGVDPRTASAALRCCRCRPSRMP